MGFTERGDWSQEAGGAIGRPIVEDKIGFRASGYYRQDGGYIDRVPFYANRGTSEENSNSRDTSGGNVAFTFAPTEALATGRVGSNSKQWRRLQWLGGMREC